MLPMGRLRLRHCRASLLCARLFPRRLLCIRPGYCFQHRLGQCYDINHLSGSWSCRLEWIRQCSSSIERRAGLERCASCYYARYQRCAVDAHNPILHTSGQVRTVRWSVVQGLHCMRVRVNLHEERRLLQPVHLRYFVDVLNVALCSLTADFQSERALCNSTCGVTTSRCVTRL